MITLTILLQTSANIGKELAEMSNAGSDQSMLIYALCAGYTPLVSAIIALYKKLDDIRKENTMLLMDKQNMMFEHLKTTSQMDSMNEKINRLLDEKK